MNKIKLVIASDHGGFELKNEIFKYLKEKYTEKYDIEDLGTYDKLSCDYPMYAKKVCEKITDGSTDRGILVCGTGLGMAIAANKFKGIRAACVSDTYSAKMSRLHNDSNVLTLGQRVLGQGLAFDIVDIWLSSNYEGGRHEKRINMLEQ